ncbi:ATP-binding cassette domain-containing protein [Cyclobacterium plantarum]|uniref:ATP-binding cassette domain-containing protein n=1 Tax=Cyclobacterium plantarum TaxID=2716263 RepID=A0ABX0HBW6_9BACT|nr:hypothetical protein [Cyclobacterium plantarum]NHE58418.1 hypothetical protein [Cyclobacterium plantarum]
MLTTQSVAFEYNQANHFAFPDIRLSAGSDLLILGESGVGKTTLLHLIAVYKIDISKSLSNA